MSNVQVQLGGQSVQVQVQSSGFARANAAVTLAADSATAAAASAASAAATLAGAALKANNLSDLASASSARTNLGLGSIATQAASAVAVTGGTVTGITDITVADGGTGASTAAAARTNLGLVIGTDVQAYDADLTTWAGITPGTGVGTFLATPSSANLAAALTDETGSGAAVFANSPTLVTPALGTPASGVLTNCTGLPVAGGGTGAATAANARTNLAVVGTAELAASGGSALVGFLQSGTSGASETVQTALRRIIVCPEQFSGTDQQMLDAAFQSAGDVPGGQLVARIVRWSRFYDTTATIDVPAYVTIEGVNQGRCGLRPTMSSGPALRASTASGSSNFLTEWRDFTIDGVNATGSAHAVEITGEKNSMLSRVSFTNFNTTSHAVRLLLGCQSIVFDQCRWLNNRLHQRIGVPYVGTSYPTTITHRSCIYEDGLIAGAEAIIIEDSSSCTWDQKCVLQGNLQPVLFRITSSASEQTLANHQWLNTYVEGNGSGTSYTWRFEGNAARPITNCVIRRSAIHGAAPTAHVYAINTHQLQTQDNIVPSGHTWLSSGGGNTSYNYTTASLYQIGAVTLADVDSSIHRIWTGDAAVGLRLGAAEILHTRVSHRFANAAASADFAIINATGIRSNGTFLLGANTVLDVDGTNHRMFAPDGDPVFYAGATENLHRNATHRFSNQAVSVDFGIFSSVGLNLGAGLALQIGGTQVVGARKTGWGAPTGTATRTAFDTATVTTAQLAERVKALLDDLNATAGHGLIGT